MTSSTLMMVGAFALAIVSTLASVVLGVTIVWQGKRLEIGLTKVRGFEELGVQIDRVRKDHKNLEELLDTYRKRDANRASQVSQRKRKQEEQEEDFNGTELRTAEEIMDAFEGKRRN